MAIISGGTIIEGALRRVSAPTSEGAAAGYGLKVAFGEYSFADDAGAVGTITMLGAETIPTGSVILGGWVDVVEAVTSEGAATLAIHVEAANDIVAEAAIVGAPWSTTGRKSMIPVFTGASTVKTTAVRGISAVIGTAALTAGKVKVYLLYLETV